MITMIENDPLTRPRPGGKGLIGDLLILDGALTDEDVERVLSVQLHEGIRFGEAALRLGLVEDHDIRRALARQYQYPFIKGSDSRFDQRLFAAYEPFGQRAEVLRGLRSQLMLRWFRDHNKVLAIVSPRGQDASSCLAANLAIVFAQLGERTLLIDTNLRSPTQHRLFGIAQKDGLSALLGGRILFKRAVLPVEPFEYLSILCAGGIVPNPQELLARDTFTKMIEALPAKYDAVIVDTPPALEFADAQIVTARAGGCMLVTRRHHTRLRDLERTAKQLVPSGAVVLGSVLSD
jgi:chain length determinant protein tyrosine kinase EpsG